MTEQQLLFFFLKKKTDAAYAIKCYRCTVGPTHRTNRTQQLCNQFTESDEFTIDCPYSTMCLKKVFWYTLQDGTKIETVSRNCADQKYTEQVNIRVESNNCICTIYAPANFVAFISPMFKSNARRVLNWLPLVFKRLIACVTIESIYA